MSTDIRGLMQFERGEIVSITLTPNEKKDPTVSLKLSAELTPDIAAIMGIRDSVFRSDDNPHARVTRLDLGGMIMREVHLTLPNPHNEGYDTYWPEDIASFRIEVDGMIVRLYMLARIKDRYLDIADWFENTNTDTFPLAIRTRQDEFDFYGKSSGDQVNMSGNQNVTPGKAEENGPLFQSGDFSDSDPVVSEAIYAPTSDCLWCSRDIPKNEDGLHMTGDGLAECSFRWADLTSAETPSGPAIVDARDMNTSTRLRKRLTRGDGFYSPEEIRAQQAAGDGIPVEDEPVIPVGVE